jgi:hypothetical protein
MQNSNLISRVRAFINTPKGAQVNLWLAYFIYWGGAAAMLPYLSVYYESISLKGTQIGQLNSIPYFVSMVSGILLAFFRMYPNSTKRCCVSAQQP